MTLSMMTRPGIRHSLRYSPRVASVGAAAVLTLASLTACGSDSTDPDASDSSDVSASADSSTSSGSSSGADSTTSDAVAMAQWSDNVEISYGDGTFTFVSDGIPDHELPDQFLVPGDDFVPPVDESEVSAMDTADVVTETPLDVEITTDPVYSEETTDTDLGMIGVVISGAQLFNDYEDMDRSFVAVDDNFSIDGVFFVDACNGHPLAANAGGGNYHYHGVPYCITDDVDVEGEHSTVLGFLIDGFPFYGPMGDGGTELTSDDLDECSGHVEATPEFPDGIYHYHLTEDRSPYSIDCYHGVVETSTDQGGDGGPPEGDGPPSQ